MMIEQQAMDNGMAMSTMDSGKKGNGMKTAVIVASVLAVFGIAFGVYGMVRGSQKDRQIADLKVQIKGADGAVTTIDTSEVTTTTGDGTTVTISDSAMMSLKQVRNLLADYLVFNSIVIPDNPFSDKGFTEGYKYYLSLKKLDYANKVSGTQSDGLVKEYSFTYDDVNEAYHRLFGSSSDVVNLTKEGGGWCDVPVYSEEQNKYLSYGGCGGLDPQTYAYGILDYSMSDDKLIVDLAYIFVSSEQHDGYTTDAVNFINGPETVKGTGFFNGDFITRRESELPKYRLTFEKEGSNYIFSNVSKL